MNSLTNSRFYPYVIAGGAALDSQSSGWYDTFTRGEISQLLDMNSHCSDVLGLLEAKGFSFDLSHYDPEVGMRVNDDSEDYAQLTEAWREYIILRRHLPDVPDGHTFIGAGGVLTLPPDPRPNAYCAYYGDEDWRYMENVNINDRALYYCVHGSYAERYINALKEEYGMSKDEEEVPAPTTETNLTLCEDGDGVNYRGYVLTENDINELMELVTGVTTLTDAGFDVEINEVSVGCMTFTRRQLVELYNEYIALKEQQEAGFTVTVGDRVEYIPDSEVYIVACTSATDYQLISLSGGNRWNNTVVKSPENYRAIPFKDFLTYEETIDQWRKV